MNLQNISIEPGADGFRIIDNHHEIPDGAGLRAQYETSDGWQTLDFVFRREPATLLHPLRRSMFVYTGKRPSRIVLTETGQSAAGSPVLPASRTSFDRTSFFGQRNFHSWPAYNDGIWDDDYLPYFLGMHFHDSRLSQDFLDSQQQPAAGDWGGGGQPTTQTSESAPVAPPEIASAAATAAIESAGIALGGGAEIFAPTATDGDTGTTGASDSPDPNAY